MIQLKTIASEFYNEYDITTLKKKFVKAVCFNITYCVLFSRGFRSKQCLEFYIQGVSNGKYKNISDIDSSLNTRNTFTYETLFIYFTIFTDLFNICYI